MCLAWHNIFRKAIFDVARCANLAPKEEFAAVFPLNNQNLAIVLIPNCSASEHPSAYNITICHQLTQPRVAMLARTLDKTLVTMFTNKPRHTLDTCLNECIPLFLWLARVLVLGMISLSQRSSGWVRFRHVLMHWLRKRL